MKQAKNIEAVLKADNQCLSVCLGVGVAVWVHVLVCVCVGVGMLKWVWQHGEVCSFQSSFLVSTSL